ncbi:MAG: hypothetical protein EP298_07715 [Gammaproteobacteria bacterium]|nr:MAG: hypothetical protein EP298_07715 [Gammaproteobacteria bacterium]UTW43679.1 hypothetical protein KFE69_06205 [bacterium SCSIO 12844]
MVKSKQLISIIITLLLPIFSYASCKSKAQVTIKNSCPFTLNVTVNNGSAQSIDPGSSKQVASVSNGEIDFNDGIVSGTAWIKTSASGWDNFLGHDCTAKVQSSSSYNFDAGSQLATQTTNGSPSWSGATGTWKFNLTICEGGYKLTPTTIGLGKVSIEKNNSPDIDGYVTLSSADDNNSYPMYDFHFTSTTTACHLKYDYSGKHYILSCDQGNVKGFFMNDNKNLIFMCQQDASGDSKCPYVTPKGSNNSYQYNYLS